MPPRLRLTTQQLALVRAIQGGQTADYDVLGESIGVDGRKASQIVSNAERSGIVTAKRDGRKYVVPSLRVTKRGEDLLAATGGGQVVEPKPRRSKPGRPRRAAPAVEPAEADGDGLEDAVSVNFTTAEIDALAGLAERLTDLVTTLRASPKLGREGAAAMRFIATIMPGSAR